MAERPGIMIYFDQWEPLLKAGDETAGALLRAAVMYARYGEVPAFSGVSEILWGIVRPMLDRDGERYEQTLAQRRYAVYCRDIRKKGYEPLSMEDWTRSQSADVGRYPISVPAAIQSQSQSQTERQDQYQ